VDDVALERWNNIARADRFRKEISRGDEKDGGRKNRTPCVRELAGATTSVSMQQDAESMISCTIIIGTNPGIFTPPVSWLHLAPEPAIIDGSFPMHSTRNTS
jgi:hypothetical protein